MSLTTKITLAISSTCPHCPAAMQTLTDMLKSGEIASIEIFNINNEAALVEQYQIRSIPWLRIGPFVLHGLHSRAEIKQWYRTASSPEGVQEYISKMLDEGNLADVETMLQLSPDLIHNFIPLITDDNSSINVRLGISAIIEELAGDERLQPLQEELLGLLEHKLARVRGDAAHFLSQLHDVKAIPALEKLQSDPDHDVREIASDAIEYLTSL